MDREDSLLAEFKARQAAQSHQKRTIRPSARYLGVDDIARQVKHLEVWTIWEQSRLIFKPVV
jgi:hypothetical protein